MDVRYIVKKQVWRFKSMVYLLPMVLRGEVPITEWLSDPISIKHGVMNGWIYDKKRRCWRHSKVDTPCFTKYRMILHETFIMNQYGVIDYKDKVVLDVGAYVGDTLLYFLRNGARYVISVEPTKKYVNELMRNIMLNKVNSENFVVIRSGYGKLSICDFLNAFGGIDVAKFDCEGCELLLTKDACMPRIPTYIIEYHSNVILSTLQEVFSKYGFKCRAVSGDANIGIIICQR